MIPARFPAATSLTKLPLAAAVTGTKTLQLLDPMPVGAAARLPPVTVTEASVKLATPPQVVLTGPTTVNPAGMASVKLKPLMAVAL